MTIEMRLGRVRAVWTDRHGGVSRAPYDTANLATNRDAPEAVAENRRRVASRLALPDPDAWCWLRQVHGTDVVVAGPPGPSSGAGRAEPPAADAAVTTTPGVPLVVLTADCAPLVLASDDAAGVVHAGWGGLLAGVIDRAVSALRELGTGVVRAALGPCIRPERYEFGREDLDRLIARFGPGVEGRTIEGAPAFDLPAGVRAALGELGIDELVDTGICTAASPDHFSYRRDGETGRQGLVAVLE